MLVFVLRESVFHLLPGWTIRFRASVVTSRERGRFDVLLTVFPPLESVFDVVFDHTLLLLLLVLMIATLLLFLLSFSFSLSRVRKPKTSSAREEDDRMGDGRCGVKRERENDQHTLVGTKREKRRKKCRKNLEIWKTNRRFFFLHFFPIRGSSLSSFFCSRLLSSSEVLPFLFEGKTKSFLLFCGITFVCRYKNTPTLCCNTIIMGVLRVKGKDLIAFRC